MITLTETNKRLDIILNLIVDTNICMNNAERLLENKYLHEESLKNHGFWVHHFSQLKFILIIQLSKFLSVNSNQKISLIKLTNRLQNESYGQDLILLLKSNEIFQGRLYRSRQEVIDDINLIKSEFEHKKALISKVVMARDKVYAHHDPEAHIERISFSEIRELVDFSSRIFNQLRGKLVDARVMFKHTRDWDIDYILKELSNQKQAKLDKIQNKLNEGG